MANEPNDTEIDTEEAPKPRPQRGGSGNFAHNPQRASEAGRKGGQMSGGNFAHNPQRASEAGRKGGQRSQGRTRQANDTDTSEAGE